MRVALIMITVGAIALAVVLLLRERRKQQDLAGALLAGAAGIVKETADTLGEALQPVGDAGNKVIDFLNPF